MSTPKLYVASWPSGKFVCGLARFAADLRVWIERSTAEQVREEIVFHRLETDDLQQADLLRSGDFELYRKCIDGVRFNPVRITAEAQKP